MIDIHCHLLPGLDDGAKTIEDALGIAQQLNVAGFSTVIATPHVIEGRDRLTPERILDAIDKLNDTLKERELPLRVFPGAENYIFPDMAKWIAEGKLMTLGNQGKYLLVELPRLDIPQYTDQVFFELQVAGVTPVLAHPERYKRLAEEPERLIEWAKRGVLFQTNLRSLSGHYGPEAKEFGLSMLENRLIHFVGSDAHREAQSSDAYHPELELISKQTSYEYVERITRHNPQRILEGVPIETEMKEDYTSFLERKSIHNHTRKLQLSISQKLMALFGR